MAQPPRPTGSVSGTLLSGGSLLDQFEEDELDIEPGSTFEWGRAGFPKTVAPSARQQPRSEQGQKLVDEYATKFSEGEAVKGFNDPWDYTKPEKWGEFFDRKEQGFQRGKLRGLQGGVGLPTSNKPGASLRSGLPEDAEPWAIQPAKPGVAPVIGAPVREDEFTDWEVAQDISQKYSPVPPGAIGKAGFGTLGGVDGHDDKSPETVQRDWERESIVKPNEFGVLSKPTFVEQVAMFPAGAAVGLGESALEEVGLNGPDRAIPLSGGGAYGYETGRGALELAARVPYHLLKAGGERLQRGAEAFMETPMTADDGVLGYIEDMARSTGNAFEAATGLPSDALSFDESDYFEMTPERRAEIAAEPGGEERLARLDETRAVQEVEKKYTPKYVPSLGVISDDIAKVAEAFVMLPMEALTAAGDPTLTVEERAARLGKLGADVALGGAGSAIETIASPRKKFSTAPAQMFFDILMLERGLPNVLKEQPKARPSIEASWIRQDLGKMSEARNKAIGEASAAESTLGFAKKVHEDLTLANFFDSSEAKQAADARVILSEAQRKLADAEATVDRVQGARPIVSDVLFEGANKAEEGVPAAQEAVKGERVRLSGTVREAVDAELAAMQRVAVAQQALKEHVAGRPLGDWSEVTREKFKAERAKSASAARPTTKNRPFGEATVKARDRAEKAQLRFKEFKPWVDEFKRLKREAKKAGTEAAEARARARRARQDEGAIDELISAERDARVGREAVRDAGSTARKAVPKVQELQEVVKQARERVKAAKAGVAAADAAVRYPSSDSRNMGQMAIERSAANARVARALQDLGAASEALRLSRARFDQKVQLQRARLTAAEQKRAGAEAGARPPGVRAAAKDRVAFEAEAARLAKELEAAKAEEAAALDVLKQEQAGAVDAFGAVKRERNTRFAEAMDLSRQGKALTPEQMKAAEFTHNSAAEWAQEARERVARIQNELAGNKAGGDLFRSEFESAKYAGLPPGTRQKVIGLEDRVRTLTEAVKAAREQAATANDPNAKNVQMYFERDLAQAKAQLAEAQSLIRRNEGQRQQSMRTSDAEATAIRNRLALEKRRQERIELKLRAEERAAQRRVKEATKELSEVADPMREAVERQAATAEALREWNTTQEPQWAEAIEKLNRLEDDFARSESKQFWSEQLYRLAPRHLLTMGTTLVFEVAKRLASKWLDQKGRAWLRQAVLSKDARIPEEFARVLEQASGRAEVMRMGLEEALQKIPKEHWPTIAKWIDMEHSLAEGGWWRAGNFNFKTGEAPGHLTKLNPELGKWELTEAGKKHVADAMEQASKFDEGTPEWADATAEVQRLNLEMDIANKYGTALVLQLKRAEAEAARSGLPGDPESLRPVWLPQTLTEQAAKEMRDLSVPEMEAASARKTSIMDRIRSFTDSRKDAKPRVTETGAPILQPDLKEYNASALRKSRVPMSERELAYGMETDLGKRVAAVGRLIYDIQTRNIHNFIAQRMARTPEQFRAMQEVARSQDKARGGVGDETVTKSWKMVADDPKYGELAGKFIPEDIWYEMMNMENLTREAQGIVNRGMATWKRWQTTKNLTTGSRNFLVNAVVYAPAAGISLLNPKNWPLYLEVTADFLRPYLERDRLHKEYVEAGKNAGLMMKTDLMSSAAEDFRGALQRGGIEPMKAILRMAYEGPRALTKTAANPKKILAESRELKAWEREYKAAKSGDERAAILKRRPQPGVLAEAEKSADVAYESMKTALGGVPTIMEDWYRFGDQLFKEVWYRKARRSGMSPEMAAAKLDEHFPNYSNVPGFAHVVKAPHSLVGPKGEPMTGMRALNFVFSRPFIAYSATSIPVFWKWAKANPAQGALYMAFHDALTGMNLAESGMGEQQADAIEGALPSYRRSNERLVARLAPKWAKNEKGEKRTVDMRFFHPAADLSIPFDEESSDSENLISALGRTLGIGEHPLIAPVLGAFKGVNTRSSSSPPIWAQGDPNVLSKVASQAMETIAPPYMPSPSSVMEGDLGFGPQRPEGDWFGGGKQTAARGRALSGVPNRNGRVATEDEWLLSQLGFKTGVASEAESVRQMSEALQDQFVKAERAAVAQVSRTGLRMNELKSKDPAAHTKAQRLIMARVMPRVEADFKRILAVKDDPVAAKYVKNYAPVVEAWAEYKATPSSVQAYREDSAWYVENGYEPVSFDEWVREVQAAWANRAYKKLRAATGAGTRETGEARSQSRTGESE